MTYFALWTLVLLALLPLWTWNARRQKREPLRFQIGFLERQIDSIMQRGDLPYSARNTLTRPLKEQIEHLENELRSQDQ